MYILTLVSAVVRVSNHVLKLLGGAKVGREAPRIIVKGVGVEDTKTGYFDLFPPFKASYDGRENGSHNLLAGTGWNSKGSVEFLNDVVT